MEPFLARIFYLIAQCKFLHKERNHFALFLCEICFSNRVETFVASFSRVNCS